MTEQPPLAPGHARREWMAAHGMIGTLPKEAYTSWIRRVGAFVVDQLVFLLLAAILGFASGFLIAATSSSSVAEGIADAIGGCLVLVYWVWNWGYRQGTTGSSVGKSLLKFKVLDERTGEPIGFGMSIVRQLAHILDAICYIGYLMPLFTAKRQTFADMIIGTVCLPREAA